MLAGKYITPGSLSNGGDRKYPLIISWGSKMYQLGMEWMHWSWRVYTIISCLLAVQFLGLKIRYRNSRLFLVVQVQFRHLILQLGIPPLLKEVACRKGSLWLSLVLWGLAVPCIETEKGSLKYSYNKASLISRICLWLLYTVQIIATRWAAIMRDPSRDSLNHVFPQFVTVVKAQKRNLLPCNIRYVTLWSPFTSTIKQRVHYTSFALALSSMDPNNFHLQAFMYWLIKMNLYVSCYTFLCVLE